MIIGEQTLAANHDDLLLDNIVLQKMVAEVNNKANFGTVEVMKQYQ
jgi:hypothetical protein